MSTIRTPNKGKCTFITPKSNRCSKHQVYIPEVGQETARRGKKRPREESGDDSPCRSHPWKIRVQCCLEYHDWIRDGSKKSKSPVSEWRKIGVDRHLPGRWLKKFLETGSVHDAWAGGRPIEFGDDSNEMVLDIALERTQEQRRCSASYIRKKMKKLNLEKSLQSAPSRTSKRR